jgi:flagella basal body P-ring formation protein FlgA
MAYPVHERLHRRIMSRLSLLILALLALTRLAPAAVVLEVRDAQTLATGNITLNDVLQSSQGLSTDDLAVVIASSPALGKSMTWTREQIAGLLPDSIKQQSPEWTGAAACTVSRPSSIYDEAQARQIIGAELARQLPGDAKFQVLDFANFQPFLIPQGDVETRVELGNGALRNEWGEASLQFSQGGQLAVTENVRFHWACTRLVWQAANRVLAGQPLQQSDFVQIETNVLKIPGMLQPATAFPDGKNSARILTEGRILMENDWVEPTLVNRNDLVTIIYQQGGLEITLQAKALGNGTRDQVIEVQNMSSHKIFNARVVDERTLVYAD